MHMPHGRFICPRNFFISTLQPMENITIASRMVKTVLRTTLRMALKLLTGTTQDEPLQIVAVAKQLVELFIAGFGFKWSQKSTEAPILHLPLGK